VAAASRSRWVGLLAGGVVLTAPNVVGWHASLMSEGVFIFLSLLSISFLVHHLRTGGWAPLVASGLLAGFAALARYVGISLIPVGALGILLWGGGSRRERWVRAVAFGFLATLPFGLWMVRNEVVGGAGLANRVLRFHAFRPERLKVFLFQPTTWVIPEALVLPRTLRGMLALLVLAGGPLLLLTQAWRRRKAHLGDGGSVLPWLLVIAVPSYIGVLIFNSLLLDAGTTYDGVLRYLTPLFVLLVLLELTTYTLALPRGWARWPTAAVLAVCLTSVTLTNAQATLALAQQSTYATGFTRIRAEWTDLATVLRAKTTIITDNPEMVYYLIDRPAYTMPIQFDEYQQAFRQDFPQQLDLARARLEAGGVLVVFGEPSGEETEVIARLQVVPLHTYDEVVVYGYPR
jgi:hypothetical protein